MCPPQHSSPAHHLFHLSAGEVRCTFQENEGCSLGSQRLPKTLYASGGCWSLQSLRAVMRRDLGSKPSSTHSLRCWGWPMSTPWVPWGLKPPYHLCWEGPHRHPTGPAGAWWAGNKLHQVHDLQIYCAILDGGLFFSCSFYAQQFIVLRKSTSSILSFVACAFDSRSKKSWPNPRSWGLTFMFYSRRFIILVLTSRALIPFELILYSGEARVQLFSFAYEAPILILGRKKISNDVTKKGLISKIYKQFIQLLKKSKNGLKV